MAGKETQPSRTTMARRGIPASKVVRCGGVVDFAFRRLNCEAVKRG